MARFYLSVNTSNCWANHAIGQRRYDAKPAKEFEETNECQFAIADEAQQARFRVSAFIQRDMAGMILRKIENKIPTVEELRLPPSLKELAMKNAVSFYLWVQQVQVNRPLLLLWSDTVTKTLMAILLPLKILSSLSINIVVVLLPSVKSASIPIHLRQG